MKLIWILLASSFIIFSCNGPQYAKRKSYKEVEQPVLSFAAGPPTLVYKTKANYDSLVPVILSEDKTAILAYPHPVDLRLDGDETPNMAGNHPYPIVMENGYLLDRKGIGKDVAFLKMSYREYAALEKAPSLQALKEMILDKDPLLELCDCGNRQAFTDAERQINKLIVFKKLRKECKVIK